MKKILIAVLVIVLAGLGFWAYRLWNAPVPIAQDFKPLTPEQREALFEELEQSSAGKPASAEVIQKEVSELERTSTPSTVTEKEKEDMFKALEASSVR